MANQPQSNRYQRAETAGGEPSMTIKEFCRSERISRSLFYIMQKEGWGPRLMYVGTSVRISGQARRDWQREREAAAAAGIRRGTNSEKDSSQAQSDDVRGTEAI
jgi:hypothetical protein